MKRTNVLKAALASLACLISAAAYADVSPASISPDIAATIDREWKSYIEPLLPLGAKAASLMSNPDDPQQRYELYQQLFKMMSAAYLGMFVGDEAHPDFWPIFNQAYNQGSANPDDAYYVASLDGRGIYQIKGVRGTVRLIDFQIGSGQFYARGQGGMMPTFNNYDVDDLHVGKDGSFSVILSSERPAGYQGDWWKLDPRSEYVIVRQTAYDWSKEVDGRFGIQRLDTSAIKPRLTPDEIAGNLRKIAIAADNWTRIPTGRLKSYVPDGLINKVEVRLRALLNKQVR